MSVFKQIAEASSTGGGQYLRDGNYIVMLESMVLKTGHKGTSVISNFRVLESSDQTDLVDAKTGEKIKVAAYAPGSKFSKADNFRNDSAAGNVKAIVTNLLGGIGVAESKIDEKTCEDACGPNNPLRGFVMSCSTYRKMTRDGKTQLILPSWGVIEQTKPEIKQNREWLDGRAKSPGYGKGALVIEPSEPAKDETPSLADLVGDV